jgi:hypothetical protein
MTQFTGCIAGALTRQQFTDQLHAAGLTDITIEETHRVDDAASSAIIRARKPQRRLLLNDRADRVLQADRQSRML